MLLAVMDLGSNSFKMTVAQWLKAPEKNRRPYEVIYKERHPIQLGGSVFTSGHISAEDEKNAFKALETMQLRLRDFSSPILRVVGTSALREAKNSKAFIERVKKELGLNIELISGPQEAAYIAKGLEIDHPKVTRGLLIDIGGGSTEVASFGRGWSKPTKESLRVGSVRMAVPYLSDSAKNFDVQKCSHEVRKKLSNVTPPTQIELLVGSAGAIESLGKILATNSGSKITKKNLDTWITENHVKSFKELVNAYKVTESRSRVIVPGAVILSEILDWLSQSEIQVTDLTLRDGLLADLIHRWGPETNSDNIETISANSNKELDKEAQRWVSEFERLAVFYHCNLAHCYHLTQLSLRIFRALKKGGFVFGDIDKKLLIAACYLHDVGLCISRSGHHKHSNYIIKHSEIKYLSDEEKTILGAIAFYHRKSPPPNQDPLENDLKNQRADIVRRLSAILRMADGLDKDHVQAIQKLEIVVKEKELILEISLLNPENFSPEYFKTKVEYFEKYFDLKTVVYISSSREPIASTK